jgi:hypothetical protein
VPLCTGCGQAAHWRNDDGSYVEFTGRERCAGCGAELYSDSQQECSGQPEPLQAFCLVKPQALAKAMLANPRYRAGAACVCQETERARGSARPPSRCTLTDCTLTHPAAHQQAKAGFGASVMRQFDVDATAGVEVTDCASSLGTRLLYQQPGMGAVALDLDCIHLEIMPDAASPLHNSGGSASTVSGGEYSVYRCSARCSYGPRPCSVAVEAPYCNSTCPRMAAHYTGGTDRALLHRLAQATQTTQTTGVASHDRALHRLHSPHRPRRLRWLHAPCRMLARHTDCTGCCTHGSSCSTNYGLGRARAAPHCASQLQRHGPDAAERHARLRGTRAHPGFCYRRVGASR